MSDDSIVEQAREAIITPKSLVIKRVPPKVRKAFVELAAEDFCDDYGMALKYLIDTVFFWVPRVTHLEQRIARLEEDLHNKPKEEESITLLDGRVIKK